MATARKKTGTTGTEKTTTKKTATKKSTTEKSATTSTSAAKTAAKSTAAKSTKSTAAKSTAAKSTAAKSTAAKSTSATKAGTKVAKTTAVKAPKKTAPTPNELARGVALAVAEAALDKKAVNVEIIDVAGKVDYADYVVVMSGTSDRQVNALARGIAEDVEKKTKTKCVGVEGLPGGAWVLMDFGDVVVHIFHHDVRGYYDIESLWIDAARVAVPKEPPPRG